MGQNPKARICIIFAKWPEVGKVKTRLAAGSSDELATQFYELCCRHTIADCGSYENDWECVVAYSPPNAGPLFENWRQQHSVRFEPQLAVPDLGARMRAAIATELARGAAKVVLVGSDIPDLNADIVRLAFKALDTAEVVFGPAKDGGFYLIGGTVLPEAALQGIQWSTSSVLKDTITKCESLGLKVDWKALPTLLDIDTFQDLLEWAAGAGGQQDLRSAICGLIIGSQ